MADPSQQEQPVAVAAESLGAPEAGQMTPPPHAEHTPSAAAAAAAAAAPVPAPAGRQYPAVRSIDAVVQLAKQCDASYNDVRYSLAPAISELWYADNRRGSEEFGKLCSDGTDPLAALDPARNTFAIVHILCARIQQIRTDPQAAAHFFRYLQQFSMTFDPQQGTLAKTFFAYLARMIIDVAIQTHQPVEGPRIVLNLFQRYTDGLDGYLTFFHPLLAFSLLREQLYEYAPAALLDRDIWRTNLSISDLSYRDALEYYYYGGMLYTKVGNLARAEEFFETCVSLPAQSASVVQIDAYKKLVLVQLLKDGKTSPIPKFTSAPVVRQIKSQCQAYTVLAETYARAGADQETVHAAAVAHQAVFEADRNIGLVLKVLGLHVQRRIQRTATTYSSLALEEVAKIVGVVDAKGAPDQQLVAELVVEMTSKGWLHARIVPASSMPTTFPLASASATSIVLFDEPVARHGDTATIERLRASMERGSVWDARLERLERDIAGDTGFLRKQALAAPREAGRYALGAPGMPDDEYEEDMM